MVSFMYGSPAPSSHSAGFQSKHASVLGRPGHGGRESSSQKSFLQPPGAITPRTTVRLGELEEKTIREKLLNPEPPQPSSYDTAWVAMVPAPAAGSSSPAPASRFPQCVDWIMQNQRGDGSWGLEPPGHGHPSASASTSPLVMDALSSTLACVLALKTWGVGEELVGKGLGFIGHNYLPSAATDDESVIKPVGFNVIFPGMLARCIAMGLEVPALTQADVDGFFRLRDKELQSMAASGSKVFMAYVAEGMGNLLDWNEVATAYQRKNGSFFNSPSTTAAAAIHSCNGRAIEYLDSLVSIFGSSVPTVYPRNLYTRLRMADTLEKTGISRRFSYEINHILDMTYRSWLANDEEIVLDMTTCALAFRLLRMHGYDISSDGLAQFSEESSFHDSIQGCLNDTEALLELNKASQVQTMEEEIILENIGSWSAKLLKQQLCSNKISRTVDPATVEHVLKYPFYTTFDRLDHRRNIEHFKTVGIQMLKSANRACFPDEQIVSLATADFHSSQTVYQEELQHLESWVKEVRLEELEFARVMPLICLLPPASTVFPYELSEARIAMSKNNILATVVDDLFDVGQSSEEMVNLVQLIQMWDAHGDVGFCSDRVEIVFRAIYDTTNQLSTKAAALQNRSVVNHLADLWANTVRAMMAEANWTMSGHVPSIQEYMSAGELSFALGPIVVTSLYLIGPELPEDVFTCQEYEDMFRYMNVCGRLLNDLQSYEREKKQGKVNSVLLLGLQGSIGSAKREVRSTIEASRIQLLRLAVKDESTLPRPCRQVFWNMCKVFHQFYLEVDGHASPKEMMHAGNAVVLEPLRISEKIKSQATSHT